MNLLDLCKIYIVIFVFSSIFVLLINIKIKPILILLFGTLFSICLSIIAYKTIPYQTDDLSRYYYWIDEMKGLGLEDSFRVSPFSTTIISNLIMFFISRTGDKNLLPLFVIIIECISIMYIIISEIKRKKVYSREIVKYIFICIMVCSLYISVSGFRFNLAVAVATVVIYNDFIKEKNRIINIGGYLLLPLIHLGTMPIVVLKLILKFKLVNKFKKLIIICPILIFMLRDFLLILPIPLIKIAIEKIIMYEGMIIAGQSFIRNTGYILFYLSIYIIIKKEVINKKLLLRKEEIRYLEFIEVFILFSIGIYFIVPESFYRNASLLACNTLPILIIMKNLKKDIKYIISVLFMSVSIFIFTVYEYLNYYRNWILK